MKVFIVLLFVFSVPIVIFLTTILYGGFSSSALKKELAETGMYKRMGTYISTLSPSDASDEDIQFTQLIKSRFTPSYLQEKTEDVIDISSIWITTPSSNPPVISFKELKEDIFSQYPELMPQIQAMAQEARTQQANDDWSSKDVEQTAQMHEGLESLESLAKSDFSIDMTTYLAPVKTFYTALQIILPTLVILVVVYLVLLLFLNHSWNSRLKWLGSTFLCAGIWGFIAIFVYGTLVNFTSQLMLSTSNPLLLIVTPIYYTVAEFFYKIYMNYQGMVSISLFVVAAGCFITVAIMNKQTPIAKKPQTKK